MVFWGQVSELAVELIAVGTRSWVYTEQLWNPVLFTFKGLDITLAPQLVWLMAPIVYYVLAIQIKRRLDRHAISR